MKTLVTFYSRTGTTKKVAMAIAAILKCDVEEIFDVKNRGGISGYFRSGKEAMMKRFAEIKKIEKDPSDYDIVIIGTPVWFSTMSSPIRTYISENKEKFSAKGGSASGGKKVAFFCTLHATGSEKTFKDMKNLCGKKPISLLMVKASEIAKEKYLSKIQEFAKPFVQPARKNVFNS